MKPPKIQDGGILWNPDVQCLAVVGVSWQKPHDALDALSHHAERVFVNKNLRLLQ